MLKLSRFFSRVQLGKRQAEEVHGAKYGAGSGGLGFHGITHTSLCPPAGKLSGSRRSGVLQKVRGPGMIGVSLVFSKLFLLSSLG